MKQILHVVAGGDGWEPSVEELESLSELFLNAVADESGAVIVTGASYPVTAKVVDVQVSESLDLELVRIEARKEMGA